MSQYQIYNWHSSWNTHLTLIMKIGLRKKCPYSELFWSAFFRIWAEYGEEFSPNAEKCRPEQLGIGTIFKQCSASFQKIQICYILLLIETVSRWCSTKNVLLEILQNSKENTCAGVSSFTKVAGLRPATLLKKKL